MAAITSDNLVEEFVSNMAKILEDSQESLQLKEIYKEDVYLVPMVPSLAISCSAIFNDKRTIGRGRTRYEMDIIGELWYYHGTANPDLGKNLVMRHAYDIMLHIIKNATLNNWLTSTMAIVRSCTYTPRLRSGDLMASARLVVLVPYQTSIANIS